MATTSMNPEITEAEMQQVRDLILQLVEDANREQRAQLLTAAAITWKNAFVTFKRMRKRIGLPAHTSSQMLAYGAIVANLKASGKGILAALDVSHISVDGLGFTNADLVACVDELREDDLMLEVGLHTSDLSDVEAAFA